MKSNILVIGGNGKTGRKVVSRLQELGHNVRIGSRSGNPSFDWQDTSGWAKALSDIEKVYITFQPDLAVPGAVECIENLVKVAQQSNIKKLVLLSGKGEREAQRCEDVVINSGIDYTIVRASWFMQNFSESFFLDAILAGKVALPKAEAKVPYVNTDDIADVVVSSLINEQHNAKLYELTGPQQLTFEQVHMEISQAIGRPIEFLAISLSDYIEMLEKHGVPSDYIWLINYLFSEVLDAPGNNVVSNDIEKVLGRKPKDFSEYVRETAATGVWSHGIQEVV